MDEESFLLLMQLMFGDHDQRRQANIKLRKKGVPDKLRVKAKYKGPGARQSLKEALQAALLKEQYIQLKSRPYTVQAFSTHTNNPRRRLQEKRKSTHKQLVRPPQLDLNAPMRSQGTISQHEPNFWGRLKERIDSSSPLFKFAGNVAYKMTDNAYVSFLSLQRGNSRVNLAGKVVTGSRITDAGVETMINAISIPVSYAKVFKLKGLNAAEFSKKFKGTFINRLTPQTRGFINRNYNKIYTNQQSYQVKGLKSISVSASQKLSD